MKKDRPVIESLQEVDWYKALMSRYIWKYHPDLVVRTDLSNRHRKRVWLPNFVDAGRLREECEHVCSLRFTPAEIAFFRESPHIERGLFSDDYLSALAGMRLSMPEIEWNAKNDRIRAEGPWWTNTWWETLKLNIVNQLYFERLTADAGLTAEEVWAEGTRRLMRKIAVLRTRPNLRYSPFGLRRTYAVRWNRMTERIQREELPSQVVGISNIRSAMLNDRPPSGTCAHEMLMVTAALAGLVSDEALRRAPIEFTRQWLREYGPLRAVAIPDTFGSESFLRDVEDDREILNGVRLWKIDSGDPFERGRRFTDFFAARALNRSKTLIFCDGETEDLMLSLDSRFSSTIGVSHGPGTHFSNDTGFTPVSVVDKVTAVLVNGTWVGTVKLGDDAGKTQGSAEDVERYLRVFEHQPTYRGAMLV